MGRYNEKDGTLIHYKFKAASFNTQYQRSRFSILDALARIGGSFSSLTSIGAAFTAIFSYKLMQSSMIGKLFHFKPKYESEVKKNKPKGKKKRNLKEIDRSHKHKHKQTDNYNSSESEDFTMDRQELYNQFLL